MIIRKKYWLEKYEIFSLPLQLYYNVIRNVFISPPRKTMISDGHWQSRADVEHIELVLGG